MRRSGFDVEKVKKIRVDFHSGKGILLFTYIFLLATVMPIMIKLLTLRGLMKNLTPGRTTSRGRYNINEMREAMVTYTDYILNLDFWIYKNTCMKRSLILYHLLRKSGMDVLICFGVKLERDLSVSETKKRLKGHAWLLLNGEVYLERDPGQTKNYRVTYSFPGTGMGAS